MAGLSSSLNIATTAEGVETERQTGPPAQRGGDTVQGFLLGMPQPAEEVAKLFADESAVSVA